MEKELRTLFRTLPLLYSVGAPLLLVLIFSGVFIRSGPRAHIFPLALPLCLVYAQLGFTRLFYNNLGAEGTGIQLYFLSPTPIRTVLLAKNLFHSVMFGLTILIAGTLAILRLGQPEGVVVAGTVAWLLFSLPSNLAAGNVFSLTMPYRVNPGRITRQGGSQANALGALLVQALVMGVGAAVFGLSWYLHKMWLAVPIFLALAVGAVIVWVRMLRNADAMANQRRDSLIATLMKTE
jgi:ABC-2 type transport system permease protein